MYFQLLGNWWPVSHVMYLTACEWMIPVISELKALTVRTRAVIWRMNFREHKALKKLQNVGKC